MSVSNVFIEILLTASENQTKITSCFEDCVQGEWTKDERLNDIGHSISMVLTTKRSIFESQQRLRFHIWFIMTHYHKMRQILLQITVWKGSKYGAFSAPDFPLFVLNTEIYGINLCIQFKYAKIQTGKNSVFGHFSRSGYDSYVITKCPSTLNKLRLSHILCMYNIYIYIYIYYTHIIYKWYVYI